MRQKTAKYIVGAAERKYLELLELYRRQKIPLTPRDFCKKVGLSGPSSIKRYMVLKEALHSYGRETQPSRMRGQPPGLPTNLGTGPDPQVRKLQLELKLKAQENKQLRLAMEVLSERTSQIDTLRSLLMAAITHLTDGRLSRAIEIEESLLASITSALDVTQKPDIQAEVTHDFDTEAFLNEIQSEWEE